MEKTFKLSPEKREYCRLYRKQWRTKYPDRERLTQRKYKVAHSERTNEDNKKFRLKYKDRLKLYFRAYNLNNYEKKRAQSLVTYNRLPLGYSCEFCGSVANLIRHHPDYKYPSIYVTTCKRCHWYADEDRRKQERDV